MLSVKVSSSIRQASLKTENTVSDSVFYKCCDIHGSNFLLPSLEPIAVKETCLNIPYMLLRDIAV
jgi:hypothetical protein